MLTHRTSANGVQALSVSLPANGTKRVKFSIVEIAYCILFRNFVYSFENELHVTVFEISIIVSKMKRKFSKLWKFHFENNTSAYILMMMIDEYVMNAVALFTVVSVYL